MSQLLQYFDSRFLGHFEVCEYDADRLWGGCVLQNAIDGVDSLLTIRAEDGMVC